MLTQGLHFFAYLYSSFKVGFLTTAWKGMPGVETFDLKIDPDKFTSVVAFYNEIDKLYLKDCDSGSNNVFQNFALKILKQNFSCAKICNPLWLEPILDTVDHNLENCIDTADYFCMHSSEVQKKITPLAPSTLKSCHMKSPKIKEALTQRDVSTIDPYESDFSVIIEMGSNREYNREYLIYDTLSLIGTVGGTLGLFVGFSFYDFVIMIIKYLLSKAKDIKWSEYKRKGKKG